MESVNKLYIRYYIITIRITGYVTTVNVLDAESTETVGWKKREGMGVP